MAKLIKATDIKWAFSKEMGTSITEEFLQNFSLFVGEIIRSDEVGLILCQGQPILMVRVDKIDFETEINQIEMIKFKGSKLKEMLVDLKIAQHRPAITCASLEVFCYRPKVDKPYHPKMHPTYNRAREKASRIVNGVFVVVVAPGMGSHVSFAQIDENTSIKFFKKVCDQKQRQGALESFATAVDNWMHEFYTKEIGTKQYKTKNRYPLAPKPLEGCELHILTTDDDGNVITYKTEV